MYEAFDTMSARRFEQYPGAYHVRVQEWGWSLDRTVDVGLRGEVDHNVVISY